MFDNIALDVVIGLVFIYLLYSLLATIFCEWISTTFGVRSKVLRRIICQMLDDDVSSEPNRSGALSGAFYRHPAIKYMSEDLWFKKNMPVYISKEVFSKVVIDLLRGQNVLPGQSFRQLIQNSIDNSKIAWKFSDNQIENKSAEVEIGEETLDYLKSIWIDSQGDVKRFQELLEAWYTEMMNKCTGLYKKCSQLILLGVGLVVAMLFNLDSIEIAQKLQNSPEARRQMLIQINDFREANPSIDFQRPVPNDSTYEQYKTLQTNYQKALKTASGELNKVNDLLAIGWTGGICKNLFWHSILGWILTAIAISFGAPFWFDLLNKLMSLRAAIGPKEEEGRKGDVDKSAGVAKIKIDG